MVTVRACSPPVLNGDGHCECCFFAPCITLRPPEFLQGQSGPHVRNDRHRYRLYKQFWRTLNDLGLWKDEQYLLRKQAITLLADQREKMPTCVVRVSKQACDSLYMYIHVLYHRK